MATHLTIQQCREAQALLDEIAPTAPSSAVQTLRALLAVPEDGRGRNRYGRSGREHRRYSVEFEDGAIVVLAGQEMVARELGLALATVRTKLSLGDGTFYARVGPHGVTVRRRHDTTSSTEGLGPGCLLRIYGGLR